MQESSVLELIFRLGSMVIFIVLSLWTFVSYFLKKKDKSTDLDHEAIHGLNNSINDLRNSQKTNEQSFRSIKGNLEYQDGVLDKHTADIGEIKGAQTAQCAILRNIKLMLREQGANVKANTQDIRNIEEAFRRLEMLWEREYKEKINLLPPK